MPGALGFLMECFEKGLMRAYPEVTRELKFGDYRSGIELLRQIAYRRGIGDSLAEGVRSFAQRIGQGAERVCHARKRPRIPGL